MKNSLPKYQIITSGSMTGTTVITSTITNIKNLDNVGIQLNWTGTPTGAAVIRVSVDHEQDSLNNVTVAGNWNTIVPSADAAPAGSAGSFYYDLSQLSAPWVELVYTNASGSGTLNAFICGKSV